MADVQVLAPGTDPAPLAYTVPGAQEIIVKALFATFDGTGAGGAFLPCIRIIAPGGKVVGEYITDASVAAGSSAEVSFAPFLRSGASAAPAASSGIVASATIIDGSVFGGTDQLIGAHSSAVVGFLSSSFISVDDGSGVFTWNNSQHRIETMGAGLFAALFFTQFSADPNLSDVSVQMTFSVGGGSSRAIWSTVDSASPPIGHISASAYGFDGSGATKVEVVQTLGFGYLSAYPPSPGSPSSVAVLVNNNSAVGFTMTERTLMVAWLQDAAINFSTFPAAFP